MTIHIRGYCERAAHPADPGSPIRFVAATEGIGRDGLVIAADGWELDAFRANPAFLWHHDYTGQRPPIGRVDTVEVDGKRLLADVRFDQGDPFAVEVERKYRDGYLNAVSVGWETKEVAPPRGGDQPARVLKAELLDISAVNIPGDPNALMERQRRALAESARALLDIVDDAASPASASWERVATDMVRLYATYAQRPDPERHREYRRLAREYARHGKTPPEWMPLHDLEALGADDIRGLFLEGEGDGYDWLHVAPETRAGAVLSKRNADDLGTAISLIQGVIARATKPPDETTSEDTGRAAAATLQRLHQMLNEVRL